MPVPDLYLSAHPPIQPRNGNPVQPLRPQRTAQQLRLRAHRYPLAVAIDGDHVERGRGSQSESLSLSNGKVVHPIVCSPELTAHRNQLSRGVRYGFALLFKIGIDEALIVAPGNKANLL